MNPCTLIKLTFAIKHRKLSDSLLMAAHHLRFAQAAKAARSLNCLLTFYSFPFYI